MNTSKKILRIELRVSKDINNLIRETASLEGKSITQTIISKFTEDNSIRVQLLQQKEVLAYQSSLLSKLVKAIEKNGINVLEVVR